MADHSAAGHHHWESSVAPFLVTIGIFLALPLGFSAYFHYHNTLMFAIFAGLGVPLLLYGVALWTSESMADTNIHFGIALTGLPLFIVSEIFIFLGLFSSYWALRLMAPFWPPEGTPHLDYTIPVIMTFILVSSSVTMHTAEVKHEHGDHGGFNTWLWITIVLGSIFLGCTIYEYSHLIHEGFTPSTNLYSTVFYTITGFHASHVLVGLAIFLAVAIPALSGKTNTTFISCASIYWHFVDLVWFFVVSEVYFW